MKDKLRKAAVAAVVVAAVIYAAVFNIVRENSVNEAVPAMNTVYYGGDYIIAGENNHNVNTKNEQPDDGNSGAVNSTNSANLDEYDAFITTAFIWIRQNQCVPYHKEILKCVGEKTLVPISVGIQANEKISDFVIHQDTVDVLKALNERAVLGVRGDYTAEILNS
jgi:hypothetical protein